MPNTRTANAVRLEFSPGSLVKSAVRSSGSPPNRERSERYGGVATILVPKPSTARVGGRPLRDAEVLHWCRDLVHAVLLDGQTEPI